MADYPFHIVLIEPEIAPNTGNIAHLRGNGLRAAPGGAHGLYY